MSDHTDIELLELAAKAAGIIGRYGDWWEMGDQHMVGIRTGFGGFFAWNPLINDGDALRLAGALQMDISIGQSVKVVCTRGNGFAKHVIPIEGDGMSEIRRAIVCAAAFAEEINEAQE